MMIMTWQIHDAIVSENNVDLMMDDGLYLMLPMPLIRGWPDAAEISSTLIFLSSLWKAFTFINLKQKCVNMFPVAN